MYAFTRNADYDIVTNLTICYDGATYIPWLRKRQSLRRSTSHCTDIDEMTGEMRDEERP